MPNAKPRTKTKPFIQVFEFSADTSKPGRTLQTARIGEIYMSRLTIKPGVVTGNYYHKKTKVMFFVTTGRVTAIFEHIKTKERKQLTLTPGTRVIHVHPWVSFATKNVGDETAVVVYFSNLPLRSTDSYPYPVMDGHASGE